MPFFSIIIPVYNVEDYLPKCVESIQQQSFTDFEIILVDDGSPDASPQLCDTLAQKDVRIVAIHKTNGGASDARNVGVQQAKGDYILFVDSDDYWEGTTGLAAVHDKILQTHADVVVYGTHDFYESTQTKVMTRGNYPQWSATQTKAERLDSLVATHNFPGAAWIMATRRRLLVDNAINFKIGIKAEDIDWIIHVLVHAKSVETVNEAFYIYRKNRPGSVTTTADYKNVEGILYAIETWQANLESSKLPEKQALLQYLATQYFTAFVSFAPLEASKKALLLPRIQNARSILNYDPTVRAKVAKVLLSIVGVRGFAFIVYQMYHWKKSK